MFTKRRIKFPIVELFTLAVVSCATLIVLYPGGDRIAITWLTGQEPEIESFSHSQPNSESWLTQSSPSASELLQRENSKSALAPTASNDQFSAIIDPLNPSRDVETTPRLESLKPVDSDPYPPRNDGIQLPDEGLPASPIGFVRMPGPVEGNSEQFQIENLPTLDEPLADDLIVREFEISKPTVDGIVEPVTQQDFRSLSPESEDPIAWRSEVSDEMVVETNELQQSADALEQKRPADEDLSKGGGDFVPRATPAGPSTPVNRLEPTPPPQSQLKLPDTNQRIASELDIGSGNPLR